MKVKPEVIVIAADNGEGFVVGALRPLVPDFGLDLVERGSHHQVRPGRVVPAAPTETDRGLSVLLRSLSD